MSVRDDLKGVLVGCGFMGGMHAQVYRSLPGVSLVAAVDGMVSESKKKLEGFGFDIPVYATLAEAISTEELDFVDVCLPTDLHRDSAIEAIEAGKALFCEKPLTLTLQEADAIIAAAESKGTSAQVGHCIRFWPEYAALMDFHESGKGGGLLSLSLVRRSGRPGYGVGDWLNDENRSGGAALDLHIHDTDFVLALLGEPDHVSSRTTEDFSGPSHIFSQMTFGNTLVNLEGGWNYPKEWGFQMAFQAVYEDAVIDYDSQNGKGLLITEGSGAAKELAVAKPEAGTSSSGEGNISDLGGYYNQLLYFTDCLKKGEAPRKATLRDGRASLQLCLKEIALGKLANNPAGV
ncbi:Gfo/Idh/MocA family protein [Pelagicoccus mobilis]|uniref:Gfo/Idh/MocA family oxidoreductase n=1 Tax=Pelagicoccus mobilis TaxID=415221 RepID=A0A934RT18_9BACT|nr:Gfo/Idh/MocA family oxidoreductase [Pelagicoccus mobilis]MBK1875846.1 Gfo/Idh/MocA family oxidoreductase [Pelagicoccus mobilis]